MILLSAKIAFLIAISLISAGLLGFGFSEIAPFGTSSEENFNDLSENAGREFSKKEVVIPSSSTLASP